MSEQPTPIHIIYASTGGNTQHVVEQVSLYWQELGFVTVLHRAEQTPISVVTNNSLFLFATSTWEHGIVNPFFKALLTEMQKANFVGKVASFIGLGDRRYEHHYFCTGMYTIKETWEKNGGAAVGTALTIGREPFEDSIEIMVKKWADDTAGLYQVNKTAKVQDAV